MTLPPPPRSPRLPPDRFRDSVSWFLVKLLAGTTAAAGVALVLVFTAIRRAMGDGVTPEQVIEVLLANAVFQFVAAVAFLTAPMAGLAVGLFVTIILGSAAVARFCRRPGREDR